MRDFRGRVAAITGAGSGMGLVGRDARLLALLERLFPQSYGRKLARLERMLDPAKSAN